MFLISTLVVICVLPPCFAPQMLLLPLLTWGLSRFEQSIVVCCKNLLGNEGKRVVFRDPHIYVWALTPKRLEICCGACVLTCQSKSHTSSAQTCKGKQSQKTLEWEQRSVRKRHWSRKIRAKVRHKPCKQNLISILKLKELWVNVQYIPLILSVDILSCPGIQCSPTLDHNYTLGLRFLHTHSTLFAHVDICAAFYFICWLILFGWCIQFYGYRIYTSFQR